MSSAASDKTSEIAIGFSFLFHFSHNTGDVPATDQVDDVLDGINGVFPRGRIFDVGVLKVADPAFANRDATCPLSFDSIVAHGFFPIPKNMPTSSQRIANNSMMMIVACVSLMGSLASWA